MGWGRETFSSLVQSRFVPQRPSLVKGVVVEPLPNGVYRVELENGAKVLAHVADRAGTHLPGSWPETRWASSWRKATAAEAEFERSGDEGTSVRQEDVSELPGDQAQRRGARDLLEDAQTQTETGIGVES